VTADSSALSSSLGRSVAEYLTASSDPTFAELTGVEIRADADVLHICLEPEVPQHRVVPILDREPVTVLFARNDTTAPRVFSVRADFPFDLVHTNYDLEADGIALCLWEEAWGDLSRTLTGQAFVERMRRWFTLTATGEVHPADQAPEPLLPGTSNTLVMPTGVPEGPWHVTRCTEVDQRYTLVLEATTVEVPRSISFALFPLELNPIVHGALKRRPYDFASLSALLAELGVDLLALLRPWLLEPEQLASAAEYRPLLIISIPVCRSADELPEHYEIWAYSPAQMLAAFGEYLGVTITVETDGKSHTGAAVGQQPEDLAKLVMMPWRVVQQLDRSLARRYASNMLASDISLVAIGAGAIGSNLVMNSMKAGIGHWTIIDNDVVLPHNTVRQTQTAQAVGFSKALALAHDSNMLLAEADGSATIVADVLKPEGKASEIDAAFAAADLVVDLSASPAVVGHVADHANVRRAASFFFNPDGSDLVVLAEDSDRNLRIDEAEAQYFLACGADPRLEGHLASARIDRLRYANACQDLTRPLPPWQVQTLSGLASGRLLTLVGEKTASANLWRLDPTTGLVVPFALSLSQVQRFTNEGMRLSVSEDVVVTMRQLRAERAPNETGGILVGSFDLARNIVHVVAALPAPPDSRQSPTYFIRGARNLRPTMDILAKRSAGQLHYVGEWHSHPDGAAARPSPDDESVFAFLSAQLGPGGSPFAMMICGADDSWIRLGWQGREAIDGVVSYEGS
jgi:integrative and conjugative element protein (TIGR02256 family)